MIGYKGMNKYMECRGMQYEVGKTYTASGDIELCHWGLHFCKNLSNVFNFYARNNDNRFFEVKAKGRIIAGDDKYVTDALEIIRELSDVEINRAMYGDGYDDGYGNGNDDGDGYGNGYGDGYGNGNGNGYGDGYGNGNGNGYGDGYGYGNGNGNLQKILILC